MEIQYIKNLIKLLSAIKRRDENAPLDMRKIPLADFIAQEVARPALFFRNIKYEKVPCLIPMSWFWRSLDVFEAVVFHPSQTLW